MKNLKQPSPDYFATDASKKVDKPVEKNSLNSKIAIFTAIVATFLTLLTYQNALIQSKIVLYKNETILKGAEANNAWAQFQAKKIRSMIIELAATATPMNKQQKSNYQKQMARYSTEQQTLQTYAGSLESQARAANLRAAAFVRSYYRLLLASALLQISLTLVSIAALIRKNWLFLSAVAMVVVAIGSVASAYLL